MSQVGQFQFKNALESLTGNTGDIVFPNVGNINIVGAGHLSVVGNDTTDTLTITADGGIADLYITDSGNASPVTGQVNVSGGDNIHTSGAGNTITIHLDASIVQPVTNSSGTEGLYSLGTNRFMHNRGVANTFLGESSGSLSLTSGTTHTTAIGFQSITAASASSYTTCVGSLSGTLLTGGSNNCFYGAGSGSAVLTGSNLILLGKDSGSTYVGAESSNICIGHPGVVSTSNKIYIGQYGTSAGQQDLATIAGVVHATNGLVSDLGNIEAVSGNLYVNDIAANAGGAEVNIRKSRTSGVITTGDNLGDIVFWGHDGTNYIIASAITSDSSGTISTNRIPANLEFWTHPDSTTASTKRMEIKTTGEVLINAPDSGTALTVTGTMYATGIAAVTVTNTKIVTVNSSTGEIGAIPTPIPSAYGGSPVWTEVTGTTQTAAVMSGYIANNGALVTITLPATAIVGDRVAVAGKGAGMWRLSQNASQVIHFGMTDTTTGTGGYLAATHKYDCVELLCVTANTDWVVRSSMGSITIV